MGELRMIVEKAIERNNGILPLEPAWVARDFLPAGRRLGCSEDQYELGERGAISERWLGSTTDADNRIKVPNEGLSFLVLDGKERVTLKDAVREAPTSILGADYARTHPAGLNRLAKLFDYKYRIPYHIHQMKKYAALVGRNPKDEAYYFPEGVPMGLEPETYFGVHPSIVEENKKEILLPYLQRWDSDEILSQSRAYKLLPEDGWHVPSGVLHAPGTALTVELQEDSDVFAMLQAVSGGQKMPKDLLFKDIRPEDRAKYGEGAILDMIDWPANGDPYFYENHHTPPLTIRESPEGGEQWIFYNTQKFSGKRFVVKPGKKLASRDAGVYNFFVWRGRGTFDGHEIDSGKPMHDEAVVCHQKATESVVVENKGREDLILFKFFGPDVNPDVPMLKPYGRKR